VPARLDRSGTFVHRSPEFAREYQSRYGSNLWERVSGESAKMPVLLKDAPGALDNPRPVPRVLLEGADSVGAWGALARVYLNIGTFSERWITLHNALVGFRKQEPFKIADCEQNSVYWQVNKLRVEYLAKFFLKASVPVRLKDAPGGRYSVKGEGVPWAPEVAGGRRVFAERCIICHSSKQPNGRDGGPLGPEAVPGDKLLAHLSDPGYRQWALAEVEKPDFWKDNFLASEHRLPVSVVKTDAGRSMGSNGVEGHMWEDFSSDTYKQLPGSAMLACWNPFTKQVMNWTPPSGGRGYYRPASLISVWATAPLLHINSVGLFNNDPSVKGRLAAFDDAIRRLLTPGKTDEEAAANRWNRGPCKDFDGATVNRATAQRLAEDHGLIWRTPVETRLHIPARHVQGLLAGVTTGQLSWFVRHPYLLPIGILAIAVVLLIAAPGAWRKAAFVLITLAVVNALAARFILGQAGDLDIGPIPAGTPVNLFANINPEASKMPENVIAVIKRLKKLKGADNESERQQALADIATQLLAISNCPDLVMDKGHYFAKDLTPDELNDLIDLLKTF
jgi:hypothetical protein